MEVSVIRKGTGPEILFVHGGAGPSTTFGALDHLAARWTLSNLYRRGYPPSPAWELRQDFEVDADDIEPLLELRPHLVAHSYGSLGSLIAAGRQPHLVRSLTIIEPPLNYLAAEDPEVRRIEDLGDEVLTHGLEADPSRLREFLAIAGAPVDAGPLSDQVIAGVNRAHGGRLPGEARPDLEAIRSAGVPALVASGDHSPGIETVCDALAESLDAERTVCRGAGHFVAAAPGFSDRLEQFLRSSESRR